MKLTLYTLVGVICLSSVKGLHELTIRQEYLNHRQSQFVIFVKIALNCRLCMHLGVQCSRNKIMCGFHGLLVCTVYKHE